MKFEIFNQFSVEGIRRHCGPGFSRFSWYIKMHLNQHEDAQTFVFGAPEKSTSSWDLPSFFTRVTNNQNRVGV